MLNAPTASIVKAAETIVRHDSSSWPIALTTKVPRMSSSRVLIQRGISCAMALYNRATAGHVTTWYCTRRVHVACIQTFSLTSSLRELSPAGPWPAGCSSTSAVGSSSTLASFPGAGGVAPGNEASTTREHAYSVAN